MFQELAGKIAIITGGAKGLGRATAELFLKEGAKVVIADIDQQAESLAASLGESARFKKTDVSNPDDVQALIDYTVSEFGGLHVMFNNAGIAAPLARLLDDSLTDFHRVMSVNVLGCMLGVQRAGRHMAQNGGGSIINTGSVAGSVASFGLPVYRASKAAIAHFTKVAAIELAEYGIRVNCILPGNVETGMLSSSLGDGQSDEMRASVEKELVALRLASQPLKRRGVPADVAQAALYLASERSSYVTGMLLPVEGGMIAGDPINHVEELLRVRAEAMNG